MIKVWGRRVMDFFFNPCPTLFDLCVCAGIAGIGFVLPALRGFYLEFYAAFLVVIGFHFKEKRHFNGASLTLLCMIGMISLLVHSLEYRPGALSFQYLNFYLMHEGFSYIFFSALLFYVIVTKATNLRLLIFALPLAMKPWLDKMIYCGQMTPILAVGVGFFTYFIYKRQFKWAIFTALVAIDVVLFNREWLMMKFECRPYVWGEMLSQIKNHPFVGSGFNKLLLPDNMMVISTWGNTWLYRHNDPLSLMAYVGVFAIIPIVLFIKELSTRFKRTWFIAPLVAVVVLCSFQVTFIFPTRVAVILVSLAWFYVES